MTETPDPILKETHPEFVYVICQGAGIVREGRPIRGNFYCYKLPRECAGHVRDLFDRLGSQNSVTMEYLERWQIRWSHRVDHRGYEL